MSQASLKPLSAIFDEAEAFARTYRFDLTQGYLALVAAVEALPQNQPGSDKSGRSLGCRRIQAPPPPESSLKRPR